MRDFSCFDIVGPIMVGPSSSHTAGAVRLGRIARAIAGGTPRKVELLLHGSFAETYRGHGTDLALVAGLLGFDTDDTRIRNAFDHAKDAEMEFSIKPVNLGDRYHANTAKFIITDRNGNTTTVVGSSIGGGNVEITELNEVAVQLQGNLPTIITTHYDQPGVISTVTSILGSNKINIAFMRVFRKEKHNLAYMIMETDDYVEKDVMDQLLALDVIVKVDFIEPV